MPSCPKCGQRRDAGDKASACPGCKALFANSADTKAFAMIVAGGAALSLFLFLACGGALVMLASIQPSPAPPRTPALAIEPSSPAPLSSARDDVGFQTPSGGGAAGGSKSKGGSVDVKGYQRSDGTVVQPHTRSAPGSRGGKG